MNDKKDLIIEAFKKYLPNRIVEKIMTDPTKVRVESERRFVTILFGDVSGFTALSEKLDPEEVVHIINRYFSAMLKIVEKYGGDVDKFIGDAIMVIFGAPVAHADDPERAVRAAVEMQQVIQAFDPVVTPDGTVVKVKMSIGINTGEVVAVNMGSDKRMEYTVMGDNVNLSSRLEGVATADQIIISDNTFQYVKDVIEYEKLKPVKVKGKEKPIQIYLVKGIKERKSSYTLPFMGRERELEYLEKFIKGEGTSLIVVGEEGIGKSRLVSEFLDKKSIEDNEIIQVRSYPFYKNVPYNTIMELIYSILKLSPSDPANIKEEKLSALSDKVKDVLLHLMDIKKIEGMPPGRLHEFIEEVLTDFISDYFKDKVIIRFEDIDNTDEDSYGIIKGIINAKKKNYYIIAESKEPIDDFNLKLEIKRLSDKSVMDLVKSYFDDKVDNNIVEFVVRKGEGNPLFIASILSSLVSRKFIKKRKGRYTFSSKFKENLVPDTVKSLMLGTLDTLHEEEKLTLQYASVMGSPFYSDILKKTGVLSDVSRIDVILASLSNKGILRFEGNNRYSFSSPLMQEVSYESLLKRRRKELHLTIAQTVEEEMKDRIEEFYPFLYYQYNMSGDIENAANYAYLSGMRSANLYSIKSAIYYLTESFNLYSKIKDNDKLYSISVKLGNVYDISGDRDNAYKYLRKSLSIATKENSVERKVRSLLSIGAFFDKVGDSQKGISYFKRALTLSRKENYKKGIASAYNNLGIVYKRKGDLDKALNYYRKALDMNLSIGENKAAARQYFNIGNIYSSMGDGEKALYYYEKSREIYASIGDKISMIRILNVIGTVYDMMGDYNSSLEYYNESLELANEIGYIEEKSRILTNMAIIYSKQGDMGTALSFLNESLKIREEIEDTQGILEAYLNMGEVYLRSGFVKEPVKYFEKVISMEDKIEDKGLFLYTLIKIEYCYLMLGRFDDYYKVKNRIDELLKQMPIPVMKADHSIVSTILDILIGRKEEAIERLNKISNFLVKIGDPELLSSLNLLFMIYHAYYGDENIFEKLKSSVQSLNSFINDPAVFFMTEYILSMEKNDYDNIVNISSDTGNPYFMIIALISAINKTNNIIYSERLYRISSDKGYFFYQIFSLMHISKYYCDTGNKDEGRNYLISLLSMSSKLLNGLQDEDRNFVFNMDWFKDIWVYGIKFYGKKGIKDFMENWQEVLTDEFKKILLDYSPDIADIIRM